MAITSARRTGDQLRRELLDAATHILAARLAIRFPSLRETARACQVSPTAVYRHFPSQQLLMTAVALRALNSLQEALDSGTGSAGHVHAELGSASLAYVKWGVANPGSYQLLFEGRGELEETTEVDQEIEKLQRRLEDLIKPFLKANVDAQAHAERLWVALHGLIVIRIRKPQQEWLRSIDEEVFAMVDIFLTQ